MNRGRWESTSAFVLHALGILYYLYEWFIILGIGALLTSVFLWIRRTPFSLLASIGSLLLLVGLGVWIRRTWRRLQFLNPHFEITKEVDTYFVNDQAHAYKFQSAVTVRALRPGVESLRTKYRWTGSADVDVTVDNPDCDLRTETGDIWDTLRISFRRPFTRREERSFTLTFDMSNVTAPALPFFAKLIDDNYSAGLTMRVVLPESVTQVLKEIFVSARAEIPIYEKILRLRSNEVRWDIKRPRFGFRYRIRWDRLPTPAPIRSPS